MPSLQRRYKSRCKYAPDLKSSVCLVTGAAGLLGSEFSAALLEAGAKVCLLDINQAALKEKAKLLAGKYKGRCLFLQVDITNEESLRAACKKVLKCFGKIDILVNNAANNAKVEKGQRKYFSRVEDFPVKQWEDDLGVGLKGAFLCCKIFGSEMAKRKSGVIVNIASDLSVIAPDQRIYRQHGLRPNKQAVKPVTYSVIKTGLIGLTRYLATYWADSNIRVNALSPGGVYTNQPKDFVRRLTNLIPLGRMADVREYREALLFLCSPASKYMTGQNLVIDGGRSVW
jgi:NAD(P)-dependent dehydrogenase (short-subunit alcohol dehydrogenase family)